jgi:uncharacterized protein (TIGR03382 family)
MWWLELAFAGTEQVVARDGVGLATDVWVPAGEGPFPTILRRTPYGRGIDAATVQQVNALGYALVTQDVRGRGGSAGAFVPFFDDATDGADTIAWIRAQSWSNGRIGTWGNSAEAITQVLAAGEGPEGLACMHLGVVTDDVRSSVWRGGAWRTDLGTNWLTELDAAGAITEFKANELDSPVWDSTRLDATERARVDVPAFFFTGYFDVFEGEGVPAWQALRAEADPSARDQQYLLLGPWTHGGMLSTMQGEVSFPADSQYNAYVVELAGWLNWCLQDGPPPAYSRVRYYVSKFADAGPTATGEWRNADDWPPASTPERLWLGDGTLGSSRGGSTEIPVDPADPVPSVGGGNLTTAAGIFDQSDVDARPDVAVFTSAPASEAAEIVGFASASVWASSTGTDGDVIVRVEVVTPGGESWLIADGVRRGRFRTSEAELEPLDPGVPALFDVDLGPVAWTLPAGHALRVAISGTLAPRYEPNPGVAEALADDPPFTPSTLTIWHDDDHPSAISVPMTRGTLGGEAVVDDLVDCCKQDEPGCGCASVHPGSTWVVLALALLRRRRG